MCIVLSLHRLPRFAIVSILLALAVTVHAQVSPPGACPALVERALTALGDNCGSLQRNTACYGYDQVTSSFSVEVEPDYFTHPADRAELTTLRTLQTAPLDLTNDRWGIAVLSVMANVPNTMPGQAVTFLVMGDAQIENQVAPENALQPVDPLTVLIQSDTEAYSQPNLSSDVLGLLPAGTLLEADALSRLGDWVRVLHNNLPAWARREAFVDPVALDALPIVTSTTRSPMQAFYFSTSFGQPQCNEAPNAVTVQSPQNIEVDLSVNGIDVRIGSTITFQSIAPGQMALTVQEGHLETVDGQIVEEGQTITALLDDQQRVVGWGEIRESTPQESNVGAITQMIFEEVIPPPPPNPVEQAGINSLPDLGGAQSEIVNGQLFHIVAAGETLFGIARLYDASMDAIVRANSLADPRNIFVGQRLLIPNPGSGFAGLTEDPAAPGNDTTNNQTGGVDCRPFRATSPLGGLGHGQNVFYWDGAPGATGYQVNVFNLDTGRSVSFSAPGTQTNVSGVVDDGNVGGGFNFAWEVLALLNGQVVCSSGRVTSQRASPPQPTATPVPTATPIPREEPPQEPTPFPEWLDAPVLVSPADGTVYDHFPRNTTITWAPVANAENYLVELEYCDPQGCQVWAYPLGGFPTLTINTSYSFVFVGAQPGRWRVCAQAQWAEPACSDWWGFRYTI